MAPYVKKGFTVIDIGPGMGYFTIPLLKLVGKDGAVIALDIQEKMLALLKRRAVKAGVAERLVTHLAEPDAFGLEEKADFILVFWMLHEVPDQLDFFNRLKKIMKSNARVLVVEPKIHMRRRDLVVRRNLGQRLSHETNQLAAVFALRGQETVSRHGGEGHTDQHLWIILNAGVMRRLGPFVIENELALAVKFQIHRRHRDELVRFFNHDMMRQPAGFFVSSV